MFSERFGFRLPAIVNFVGGGGKTTLILKLAEEQSTSKTVIYTTTVRMHPPHPANGLALVGCEDPALLNLFLDAAARSCPGSIRTLVITKGTMAPRLLRGVEPEFPLSLDQNLYPIILNEADGARSMSLKMPHAGEPVLMRGAGYLVPVIGLDCVNKPLGPETLFRWEMAAARHSLQRGQNLSPELAAHLLMHPEGVCKDWQPGMKIVPYINKADREEQDTTAKALALALMQNKSFPVERVVWGSLHQTRAQSITARTV